MSLLWYFYLFDESSYGLDGCDALHLSLSRKDKAMLQDAGTHKANIIRRYEVTPLLDACNKATEARGDAPKNTALLWRVCITIAAI